MARTPRERQEPNFDDDEEKPRPLGRARGSRRGPIRSVLLWSVVLGLWGAIGFTGLVGYYAYTFPDIGSLEPPTRRPAITLVAEDGSTFATYGDLFGEMLRLDEMPRCLPLAVMAIEDRRFSSHPGVDPRGLLRAMWANIRAGRVVQGGSTVTQQLAKNLFLTPERTLRRKVQETLLALWLERKFTKAQILSLYLNRVYLGAGAHGVDAAARRYFAQSARKLDLWQCALLAGLLKAPSRYNPVSDPEAAERRTHQVLGAMVEAGFLARAEAEAAKPPPDKPVAVAALQPGGRYFADWIMDQVQGFVGFTDRDIVVRTTLDPRLQILAESQLRDALATEGLMVNAGQGALVAMSPDGAVRAMVGGEDYGTSQFNRATQALRQPGSAFKAILYLAALQAGVRPDDKMFDGPVAIGGWRPKNYEGTFRGEVTVREAVARSINTVAAQVVDKIGRRRVIQTAQKLGITSELRADATIALGTSEVSPIELVSAFAALANGGDGVIAFGIREIRDAAGNVLFRRHGGGLGRAASREEIAMLNEMLSAVMLWGTGQAARLDRPAAGKTGTTQDFRDAWFVGYTPDLVAGVWLGNDDNRPMKHVTGGGLPARLWKTFMAAALAGTPPRPLPLPAAGVPVADAQRRGEPPVQARRPNAPAFDLNDPEARLPGMTRQSN